MEAVQQQLGPLGLNILRLFAWFVLLAAIFVPLEKLWGVRRQKFFREAFPTDVLYFFLSGLAPNLILVLPLSAIAFVVHHFIPSRLYLPVAAMPVGLRFAAALVVGEIGSYWGHRWAHEIPFIWRFHAIHHSAEEIDWLVNTRAHPIDMVFVRLCGFVPMYLLGLAQPMGNKVDLVPVLVTLAVTMWGFFIHANLKWRFGWMEWLVSSPAFHHWHHTNDGPDLINKNYASMLPWVDKCFGTFYLPKQWPEKYGIDMPMAPDLTGQLLQPLLPDRRRGSEVSQVS